jgi:hypothetical protein
MINTLTTNKEKQISDINSFYNSTVLEQSKLLNKVETDQKNIIENYEQKVSDLMNKNVDIYNHLEKYKHVSETLKREKDFIEKNWSIKYDKLNCKYNDKLKVIYEYEEMIKLLNSKIDKLNLTIK